MNESGGNQYVEEHNSKVPNGYLDMPVTKKESAMVRRVKKGAWLDANLPPRKAVKLCAFYSYLQLI